TLDSEGNVYTAFPTQNKVVRILSDGSYEVVGETGAAPQMLTFVRGHIFTANDNSRDISKITLLKQRKLALNANDEIIRVGSYSLTEEFTGDMWINGKEIFRKVILDGATYPADIGTLIREQAVGDSMGDYVILEYTKI